MIKNKTIALLMCAASLALSGCGTMYSNAKILEQDNANIAFTINKDLSNTVINTHTGERVKPCDVEIKNKARAVDEVIAKCAPEGHDLSGPPVSDAQIVVKKGSICIIIVSGSRGYLLCQPPHNLGF